MTRLWYRLKVFAQVVASRLRVHAYRLQGGRHIHSKCVFGQGVCVERPWLVTLGERCMLQRNVWLNVGADSAELEIGAYTFLGRGVEIEVSRAVRIGRGGADRPRRVHYRSQSPDGSGRADVRAALRCGAGKHWR